VMKGQVPRVVRTRHGFRIQVDPGDWLGRHVFVTGDYEPETSRLIAELLPPGGTMIDVGANIGFFSLLAARCVGTSGKVIAFEPLPVTRRHLERNLQLNGMAQVVVRGEAVCDRPGEDITFYEGPRDHRGISSCRPIERASRVHRVRAGRLDDLLPADRRVDLIKIDVEGAECQALDGMARLLRRDHPDVIVEVTDRYLRDLGHSAEALCSRLRGHGYEMYAIGHGGLVPIAGDLSALPGQFNALFTARSRLPDRVRVQVKDHRTG
jgi:FkbM family methyltransferase